LLHVKNHMQFYLQFSPWLVAHTPLLYHGTPPSIATYLKSRHPTHSTQDF
jgi:hypothetical protein